jgi:hypothetical protein
LYRKSYLYLVSHGLEETCPAPIIGMERACMGDPDGQFLEESSRESMRKWQQFLKRVPKANVHIDRDKSGTEQPGHFERLRDSGLVTDVIQKIRE